MFYFLPCLFILSTIPPPPASKWWFFFFIEWVSSFIRDKILTFPSSKWKAILFQQNITYIYDEKLKSHWSNSENVSHWIESRLYLRNCMLLNAFANRKIWRERKKNKPFSASIHFGLTLPCVLHNQHPIFQLNYCRFNVVFVVVCLFSIFFCSILSVCACFAWYARCFGHQVLHAVNYFRYAHKKWVHSNVTHQNHLISILTEYVMHFIFTLCRLFSFALHFLSLLSRSRSLSAWSLLAFSFSCTLLRVLFISFPWALSRRLSSALCIRSRAFYCEISRIFQWILS